MSVVIGDKTFHNNTKMVELCCLGLTSLPIEIGYLVNLQWLNLSKNVLTILPVEIGNLVNLHILECDTNQIESIPVEIGNLVNLKKLWLSNNKLTSLPIEILNFMDILVISDTSYQINNIPNDTEFIILSELHQNLENLPLTLKTLYLHKDIDLTKHTIKLPYGCIIERF